MYPVKPGVFRVGDFFYSLVRQQQIRRLLTHEATGSILRR